ncbi:DUF2946 family protein [Undibacterium sp. RuRC25W]|uniref:DUF2946 family protein n=1 Tax=Undibacterium sp. RuRC25W TaxID=3413047 RepID=UPI003BEF81C8
MDDIVKAAMAKWPNVPHCYGWLALDARGQWRMRDERCQALNLPGDVIRHQTLIDFINRNYQCDDKGCWYFQNGPQRVYVDLDATPYIIRTIVRVKDTQQTLNNDETTLGLQLHTGQFMPTVTAASMDADGNIVLSTGKLLALVDGRDLAQVASHLQIDGQHATDDALLHWLETSGSNNTLTLNLYESTTRHIHVQFSTIHTLMTVSGNIATPR